jgi:hypothetical protein
MHNGKMRIHDVTKWATEELKRGLMRVVEAKANRKEPYYIMVVVKNGYDGPPAMGGDKDTRTEDFSTKKVVTNRLVILDRPPPIPLIGTSLWKVNNVSGRIDCIYALPPDRPFIGGFEVGQESEVIARSAQGMPILY